MIQDKKQLKLSEWSGGSPQEPTSFPKNDLLICQIGCNANLKVFTQALKENDIIDVIENSISGSVVVQPFGLLLFRQINEIIRKKFSNFGMGEYQFPDIVNSDTFSPVYDLLSLKDKLLHVGNDEDFQNKNQRGTLCPTGEEIIYTYWQQKIKSAVYLPIEMFRQANFFRPSKGKHRGGLFQSMEAWDIFEFHCCYEIFQEEKFISLQNMLAELTQELMLPVLWSDRPLISNNSKISLQTIAADTLLPIGKTLQVSAIYNQGQLMSKPFGIGYKKNGQYINTAHITGFISRRAAYASLFTGLKKDNRFFIHPNLAPIQVALLYRAEANLENIINQLKTLLINNNIRVSIDEIHEKDILIKKIKNLKKSSPCLIIIMRKKNDAGEDKVTMLNSLESSEKQVAFKDTRDLADTISENLKTMGGIMKLLLTNIYPKILNLSALFLNSKNQERKTFWHFH